MILKSLTLQNFRSYGDAPVKIEFERGILLFEGDIGSGKSSILYAIEFAFFGLGEVEGKFMLRGSAPAARVELEFEVGETGYRIIRTIERKRGTRGIQTRGWLSEAGGQEEEMKPTEMKSRILQILSFREKLGKSTSRIYRFAVFTPQEYMKEVLNQAPDDRIETLRRAFGIEDYSFAGSNADILISRLNSIAKVNAELSRALPSKEEALRKASENLRRYESDLKTVESELSTVSQTMEEIQSKLTVLETERDEARRLQLTIPQIESSLLQLQSEETDSRSQLERYEKEQKRVEQAKLTVGKLKPEYQKYLEAKKRIESLEELQERKSILEKEISELNRKISTKETKMKTELAGIEESIGRLDSALADYELQAERVPELKNQAKSLEESVRIVVGLQKNIDALNLEIGNEGGKKSAKVTELERLRVQVKKLDGISNESSCPLCGQKLNPEHLNSVMKEYGLESNRLQAEIRKSDDKMAELRSKILELNSKIQDGEKKRQQLEKLRESIVRIEEALTEAKKRNEESTELNSKARQIRLELESRDFVHSEEVELSSLKLKHEALIGPLKELLQLRTFVRKLEDSGLIREYLDSELISKKDDLENMIASQREKLSRLEKSILKTNQELKQKREQLEQLEPSILEHEKLRLDFEELQGKKSESKSKFDTLSANVASLKEFIRPLNSEVEDLRSKSQMASLHRGYASWLETLFLPAVENIESHVLDSIRDEFQRVFHRWFSELIEDPNVSASVDERFTPNITQSGYDLDTQSLSGGERTAVALAYRLALNYMVKRANESMQTNLLILDEPTEGFSREQTYRLRGVLEEVECDQVILVSHERDLESLADKIYSVEKQNGISVVKLAE